MRCGNKLYKLSMDVKMNIWRADLAEVTAGKKALEMVNGRTWN